MAPESPKIRVLLVDDHPLIRDGLKMVLSNRCEFDVIDEAGDGLEAIEKAIALRPDVVLMDINMPRLNGIQAAKKLKAVVPETKVVMLTMHSDVRVRQIATRAGAAGFVTKDSVFDTLCETILRVHRSNGTVTAALPHPDREL